MQLFQKRLHLDTYETKVIYTWNLNELLYPYLLAGDIKQGCNVSCFCTVKKFVPVSIVLEFILAS